MTLVAPQYHGIKTPDGLGLFCVMPGPHDPASPSEQFWPVDATIPEGYVQVPSGWYLDNGTVRPVVIPAPSPVHDAISNADLRRGLVEKGVNPALVTAYLNGLPESQAKWMAVTDWEYSNYIERAHPMLDGLAPNFNLSPADIDEIFTNKPAYPIR